MAQLAQAYVHLRPYTLTSQSLAGLGRATEDIAQTAARQFYDRETEVDVRLEEGSLKVWVTVASTLFGAYYAVGNYKGFKESITELCQDARKFGFNVCDAFTREAGASPEQIYRIEKRLKTPGRINRAIKILEKLNANGDELGNSDLQRLLGTLRQEIEAIERDLNSTESSVLKLALNLERLPPMPSWPQIPPPRIPRVALRSDTWLESIPNGNSVLERALTLQDEQSSTRTYHNRLVVRPRDLNTDSSIQE